MSSAPTVSALQVQNVGRFSQALLGGVVRAKAFGCGLLLVRRAE